MRIENSFHVVLKKSETTEKFYQVNIIKYILEIARCFVILSAESLNYIINSRKTHENAPVPLNTKAKTFTIIF